MLELQRARRAHLDREVGTARGLFGSDLIKFF